jgi:hypothetical protein
MEEAEKLAAVLAWDEPKDYRCFLLTGLRRVPQPWRMTAEEAWGSSGWLTPATRYSTTGGGRRRGNGPREGGYGEQNASASWTRIGMRSMIQAWHHPAPRWKDDCVPEAVEAIIAMKRRQKKRQNGYD